MYMCIYHVYVRTWMCEWCVYAFKLSRYLQIHRKFSEFQTWTNFLYFWYFMYKCIASSRVQWNFSHTFLCFPVCNDLRLSCRDNVVITDELVSKPTDLYLVRRSDSSIVPFRFKCLKHHLIESKYSFPCEVYSVHVQKFPCQCIIKNCYSRGVNQLMGVSSNRWKTYYQPQCW